VVWRILSFAAAFGFAALLVQAGSDVPFSIQEKDGVASLVKSNGERFFSFGVCVLNQGATRASFNPSNPGYAAFQHYSGSDRWPEAMFTTPGCHTIGPPPAALFERRL